MIKTIKGKNIAEKIKDKITQEIYSLGGVRPSLAIVLVGERADSQLYVSLKEKEGVKVGVDTHLYKIESEVEEKSLIETITWLNKDETIDGILLQLPLPDKFDTDEMIKAIDCNKDVDGFHPQHPKYIISPVLASINACLQEIKFNPENKQACILHNSDVFGKKVKALFKEIGLKVLPKEKSAQADLLVTALGEPLSVKKEMVKQGAVLIDIGISKIDGKVVGDIDLEDVKDKAAFITPVPGGIGPMTIAFLFKNVLEVHKRKNKKKQ